MEIAAPYRQTRDLEKDLCVLRPCYGHRVSCLVVTTAYATLTVVQSVEPEDR